MDMTDKDDILIGRFLQEAAPSVADDGFTERVMQSLPSDTSRAHQLSRLWTWFCIATGIVLFFVFDGVGALKSMLQALLTSVATNLEVWLVTMPMADLQVNPLTLLLLMAFVGVYLPYQIARRLSAIQ